MECAGPGRERRGEAPTLLHCSFLLLFSLATAQKAPILPLRWHFNPPVWTNDPSLLYTPATGQFHNYYQAPQSATPYAPWSPQGGGPVWRHATTPDFAHFYDHGPINLTKNEGTGSLALINDSFFVRTFNGFGGISIGGTPDVQASAWVDLPPFPRVPPPPSAPGVNPFTGDPFLYYDDQHSEWVLLVASCLGGTNFSNCVTPRLRKYAAADAVSGAFAPVSEAYFTGPSAAGIRPECPRAWRFTTPSSGAHLLAWSSTLQGRSLWFLGSATRTAFTAAASGTLDGGAFYAATLSPLPSAPRGFSGEAALLVGWVHDARPIEPTLPWYNTLSAPRYISAAQDGLRVAQAPAPLLEQQRGALLWSGNASGRGGGGEGAFFFLPAEASGASLWVEAQLVAWDASCSSAAAAPPHSLLAAAAAAAPFSWGLAVLASPDAQEATLLRIVNGTALVADSTRGSLDPAMGKGVYSAAVGPTSPGVGALTALLDVSLLEAFAHSDIEGEAVVTIRSYPTRPDSARVAVLASPPTGALGFCVSVRVYAMP